jgi:hypothetical protein
MPLQWVSTFRLEPTCRQPLLLSPTMGSCGDVAIAALEQRCDYGQQTTSPTPRHVRDRRGCRAKARANGDTRAAPLPQCAPHGCTLAKDGPHGSRQIAIGAAAAGSPLKNHAWTGARRYRAARGEGLEFGHGAL